MFCPNCGTIFSLYSLSSKKTKDKYVGAPSPLRALAKYDVKVNEDGTFVCPRCDAVLSLRPRRLIILPYKKLEEAAIIDEENRKIYWVQEPSIDLVGETPAEVET